MTLPSESVTLTTAQVEALNRELSNMRHDINNHLSLIMAATELIRHKPQTIERMTETLNEQPRKVSDAMMQFSAKFEQAFGIKRS